MYVRNVYINNSFIRISYLDASHLWIKGKKITKSRLFLAVIVVDIYFYVCVLLWSYMQVMVVMNIIEGVICIVVDVIQLAKIISDENSAKSSIAEVSKSKYFIHFLHLQRSFFSLILIHFFDNKIYKDQSKYVLIGLSIGILVMLCLSTFINIRFLIFIRNSLKVSLAA